MKFAEGTTVAVSKTRAEIEALAMRHGATRFSSGWIEDKAAISFACKGRLLRFVLPMPSPDEIRATPEWRRRVNRSQQALEDAVAGELRRRWRALLLVIKGRFEAAADGIETFDEAFLAHIVTANNMTVMEVLQLAESPVKLLEAAK